MATRREVALGSARRGWIMAASSRTESRLRELVQAYAALARGGVFAPLQVLAEPSSRGSTRRVFSSEVASLTGHILSDADGSGWATWTVAP